jgi:hypothetical protein
LAGCDNLRSATTVKLLPGGPTTSLRPGDKLLEVTLNDHERRVVGRVLTERKALLIETTEDTTHPDGERRAGLIELSVIESILGKCYASEMSRQPVNQAKGSGRRNESESFSDPHKHSGRVS